MPVQTKYQTTLFNATLYPVIVDDGGTPEPPDPGTGEAHGDVSVLGIMGRVGVAARS